MKKEDNEIIVKEIDKNKKNNSTLVVTYDPNSQSWAFNDEAHVANMQKKADDIITESKQSPVHLEVAHVEHNPKNNSTTVVVLLF